MLMEMYMMEVGLMIKLKATELIYTWMELSMWVTGKMINSTEVEWKLGLMVQSTKESML